uniref:Uncharacterized protein n=1 Tax=Zea mays TaxID=4577 RepID=A0A804RQV8_MAIZE
MRGIGAAAAARRHTPFLSSRALAFSSSSRSGGGDGGFGHGRGRGLPTAGQPRAPGRPISNDDDADPFSATAPVGRGRGEPEVPSSPGIPSFAVFSGVGRGRGRGSPLPPPPPPEDASKQPTLHQGLRQRSSALLSGAAEPRCFLLRAAAAPPAPDLRRRPRGPLDAAALRRISLRKRTGSSGAARR